MAITGLSSVRFSNHSADLGPLDLYLRPFGHFQTYRMLVQVDYRSVHTAGCHYFVAFLQILQHFLVLALLLLLRPHDQEVQNGEGGEDHQEERHVEATALRGLAST